MAIRVLHHKKICSITQFYNTINKKTTVTKCFSHRVSNIIDVHCLVCCIDRRKCWSFANKQYTTSAVVTLTTVICNMNVSAALAMIIIIYINGHCDYIADQLTKLMRNSLAVYSKLKLHFVLGPLVHLCMWIDWVGKCRTITQELRETCQSIIPAWQAVWNSGVSILLRT